MATVIFSSELQRFTGEEKTSVSSTNYRDLLVELLAKYQRLPEDEIKGLAHRYQAIPISALEGRGLHELLARAEEILWDDGVRPPGEEERFRGLVAQGRY